jgi:hypothetical protein
MANSAQALSTIPQGLRGPLLQSYNEIVSNFSEHRWEPSELNGGKFCEAVYTIIAGSLVGVFAAKPNKPKNMADACRALEGLPANPQRIGDRSLRILIPRALPVLYEIRNNRGVGHLGGDVDPNLLDATAVLSMASWVLAELVRVFHNVSTTEAQQVVDALIERRTPLIWVLEDQNVRRVLDPDMKTREQTLVLLHQAPAWVKDSDLASWVEYSSDAMYRKRVLKPLHDKRLIEHDTKNWVARISPLGIKEVETKILKTRHA